jgi:hypothetical protein
VYQFGQDSVKAHTAGLKNYTHKIEIYTNFATEDPDSIATKFCGGIKPRRRYHFFTSF